MKRDSLHAEACARTHALTHAHSEAVVGGGVAAYRNYDALAWLAAMMPSHGSQL